MNAALAQDRAVSAELAAMVPALRACAWCDRGQGAGPRRCCTHPACTADGKPVPVRFARSPRGKCGPGGELMQVQAWGL